MSPPQAPCHLPLLSDTPASFIFMALNALSNDRLYTCLLPVLPCPPTEHKQNRVGGGSLACFVPGCLSSTCDKLMADAVSVFVE